MRKIFVQIAAFCLALSMVFTYTVVAFADTEDVHVPTDTDNVGDDGSNGSETDEGDETPSPDLDDFFDIVTPPDEEENVEPDTPELDEDTDPVSPDDGEHETPGTGEDTEPVPPDAGEGGETDPPASEEGGSGENAEDETPEEGNDPVDDEDELEDIYETLIRVGLYYGDSALAGANLLNDVGTGYRFGYMDGSQFVQVGSTLETGVSVVKTQNVYYSPKLSDGFSGYSDKIVTDIAVGCYHLCLNQEFLTFEDAKLIADSLSGGFPAWIDGSYQVRIGAYLTKDEAVLAAQNFHDVTIVGTSSYGLTVLKTGTCQPVFQYDDKTNTNLLVVKPGQDNSVKTTTYFKGNRYFGSFRYERINGGNLTVVSLVPMEDYVNCVISREMSDSWPIEALKAQAVSARSYALTCSGHPAHHFDVCSTTCCQVYMGMSTTGMNTLLAAEETAGQYALYNDSIIRAFYFSSDGGATENCSNVWTLDLPYLVGKEDPYEALIADKIYKYYWTVTYTGKELQERLHKRGYTSCAEVANLEVIKTTDNGNVYSVRVTDVNGATFTFSKDNARIVLGTKSLHFSIADDGGEEYSYSLSNGETISTFDGAWVLDGEGNLVQLNAEPVYAISGTNEVEMVTEQLSPNQTFVINGTGSGHHVGMSQWGARSMALLGYTYEEILTFYFDGIEIGFIS